LTELENSQKLLPVVAVVAGVKIAEETLFSLTKVNATSLPFPLYEMTYIVSGGALNSTHSPSPL